MQQAQETGGCATGDLGDRVDGGDTMEEGDTGLTGSTVLRHNLTEIKPKMGNSDSKRFFKSF